MDIAWLLGPQRQGPPPGCERSTAQRPSLSSKDASCILNWGADVATSHARPRQSVVGGPGAGGGSANSALSRRVSDTAVQHLPMRPGMQPQTVVRRTVTSSSSTITPIQQQQQNSDSHSTSSMVGAVLGAVAAGAAIGGALTYMGMRSDREKAPQQEYDAPGMPRRSTFHDPYPDRRPRYVEVEKTVKRFHYDESAGKNGQPTPSQVGRSRAREVEELDDDRASQFTARPSVVNRSRPRSANGSSRDPKEGEQEKKPLLLTETEHVSDVGEPKLLTETEHRSDAGGQYGTASDLRSLLNRSGPDNGTYVSAAAPVASPAPARSNVAPSSPPSDANYTHSSGRDRESNRSWRPTQAQTYVSNTGDNKSRVSRASPIDKNDDAESYVSARTERTTKAPAPSEAGKSTHSKSERHHSHRHGHGHGHHHHRSDKASSRAPSKAPSKAQSKAPTSSSRLRPSSSRAPSHAPSRLGARDVALPRSQVGVSLADWDDDKDSIAPEDSISQVG